MFACVKGHDIRKRLAGESTIFLGRKVLQAALELGGKYEACCVFVHDSNCLMKSGFPANV